MRFAIICAVALLACSSKSSGPSLSPGQRAGEVIELSGEARAVNPTLEAPRSLAVGADVLAGDTIETEAGASLRVRLDHNQAMLAIEGDKRVVLAKSAAWTATARTAGALDQQGSDQTQVAGRHSENIAGDTRATVRNLAPDSDPVPGDSRPDPVSLDPTPKRDEEKPDVPSRGPMKTEPAKPRPAPALSDAHLAALQGAVDACSEHRGDGPIVTQSVRITVDSGKVTSSQLPATTPEPYAACIGAAMRRLTLAGLQGTRTIDLKL